MKHFVATEMTFKGQSRSLTMEWV